MLTLLLTALTVCPAQAAPPNMDDVRARLESDFHQALYARTYQSILERIEDNGYFQESLTGAYHGMFPRTVGGLVSLLLETGETAKCEALIDHVLRATELNDMERIPHVIGNERTTREPRPETAAIIQTRHPVALYRLDQPDRFGGAQEFTAPDEPIIAIEPWLSGHDCEGLIRLEIADGLDGEPLATAEIDAAALISAGAWARFEFDPPASLQPGDKLVVRAHFEGDGVPVWWGCADATDRPLGGGRGRDTHIKPGWLDDAGHVTAFAVDTGRMEHVRRRVIPILSDADEIDGQAHVLMAWARLALKRGPTDFEDRTYAHVAKLMDRTTDWPYMTPYYPPDRPHILLTQLGLIRSVCFEHSREGRFWEGYDILTQSFVAAALTDMIRVADRRDDAARAETWRHRLRSLESAIRDHMTRELDGKTAYLEMRIPDGGGGVPFEGIGWVNFAPVAAQWEGVDREILRNTIAAYRRRALFEWEGHTALALDWLPDQPLGKMIIGKAVGWEIVFSLGEGEPERICQWLDLLEAVNTPPIYMEAASLRADGQWDVADAGNGEQCVWWCWGMARARLAVGISAAP